MLLHSTQSLPFSFTLSPSFQQQLSVPASPKLSPLLPESSEGAAPQLFTSKLLLLPPKAPQTSNPIESDDSAEVNIGEEIWPGEAKFTGSFKNEVKNGYGTLQFKDGLHYTGQFLNDNINGYGVARWPDKRYEGFWLNNQKNGAGTEDYADGRRYTGEFRNDKKEGFGEFHWANGSIFKGFFVNGKQHGKGEFINQAGVCKRGLWENGKRMCWIEEDVHTPKALGLSIREEVSLSSSTSINEQKKSILPEKTRKITSQ